MEHSCNAHKARRHNLKRPTATKRKLPLKSYFDGQPVFKVHEVTALGSEET